MRTTRSVLVAALAALGAAVAPAAGATAAEPTHRGADGPPPLTVVASGLDHPRGIVAGPAGTFLVAESGEEGAEPCLPPSPGTANKPACLSTTGAVTLGYPGGQARILDGLASIGAEDGTVSSGPHDLALTRSGLRVAYGYANNPEGRDGLGPAAAALGTVVDYGWSGEGTPVADLAAFEASDNPDGLPGFAGVWSNPYSIVADGDRSLVADSGGNTVLEVAADGTVSTVALFPIREVPGPGGAPVPMQSVPTGLVRGPDGAVYVGELTGFPFPPGGARVYRLVPGQLEPEVVAEGFTNIIDVDFDRRGRLVVLEGYTDGIPSGNPAGALKRVEADGSITTLVDEGLITPTAMDVTPGGTAYISNNATSVDAGEVVRLRLPD